MPDNRETLQVNQPDIVNPPENNWPEPLVDPSNKLKMVVTNGGNGQQIPKVLNSTSQQDAGEHQLTEGKYTAGTGDMESQGSHGNKFQTSQQNAGDHATPESGD